MPVNQRMPAWKGVHSRTFTFPKTNVTVAAARLPPGSVVHPFCHDFVKPASISLFPFCPRDSEKSAHRARTGRLCCFPTVLLLPEPLVKGGWFLHVGPPDQLCVTWAASHRGVSRSRLCGEGRGTDGTLGEKWEHEGSMALGRASGLLWVAVSSSERSSVSPVWAKYEAIDVKLSMSWTYTGSLTRAFSCPSLSLPAVGSILRRPPTRDVARSVSKQPRLFKGENVSCLVPATTGRVTESLLSNSASLFSREDSSDTIVWGKDLIFVIVPWGWAGGGGRGWREHVCEDSHQGPQRGQGGRAAGVAGAEQVPHSLLSLGQDLRETQAHIPGR